MEAARPSLDHVSRKSDLEIIQSFLPMSRSEQYTKGQEIVIPGSESNCVYYVEEGSVEVSTSVKDTKIAVAIIGAGNFFGEIGFFDGISRVRDVRATENTIIRKFDQQAMKDLRHTEPVLYSEFITYMAQSICVKFRRILEEREPLTAYAASLSTGRRSFQESKPLPDWFFKTPQWSRLNHDVEGFKAAFFDLTHRLQRNSAAEIPPELEQRAYRLFDDINDALQEFTQLAVNEADEFVWGYVFKEFFPYYMRSRFAERAYYKPRGYAGDFMMMEMIYQNNPDGDGKIGQLVDGWCLNSASARAVRGRRRLLANLLEVIVSDRNNGRRPVRIMNLACGSNRELFDFLARFKRTESVEAVCVDADLQALEYTNTRVNVFPHRAAIRLMNDNVVKWSLGSTRHQYEPFDIIYSTGLTDYLDRRLFLAVVSRCYEHLKPGGVLIVGNFDHANPNRLFMDHILNWKLIYRSANELRELFAESPFGNRVRIEAEEEGVNLFAIATKVDEARQAA